MCCSEQILEATSYKKKKQLYDHLPPISQNIQIKWVRLAGHCWWSKDKVIQWTPTHGRTSVGQSAITYIYQLCTDTGCHLEDLPKAKTGRDRWQENPYCWHALMMRMKITPFPTCLNSLNRYFASYHLLCKYLGGSITSTINVCTSNHNKQSIKDYSFLLKNFLFDCNQRISPSFHTKVPDTIWSRCSTVY